MFRIMCGAIIILGFTYLGRLLAEKEKSRITQLNSFCDGLSMLEFNIRYMSFPMGEAFGKAAECCLEPVRNVFEESAESLESGYEMSSGEAFCQGMERNKAKITLSEAEVDILKSFALSLGKGDKISEIANIQAAKVRLTASCKEAVEEVNKKVKMIKGISTLVGIFIVIVLL